MTGGHEMRTAMVLAAGRGRRLAPLSEVLPKPALPLLGRRLVGWAMAQAAAAGAESVVVNAWHLAERLEEAVAEEAHRVPRVALSREPQLMGGAGGLALARDRGLLDGAGPLLVLNGDVVFRLDLEPVLARHRESDDLVTLALLPHLDPTAWSRVLLDASGRVERICEPGAPATGEVPLLYTGVMVMSREALATLPSAPGEIGDLLWAPAKAVGRFGGVVVSGYWREVGTPEAYRAETVRQLGDQSWCHPEATVAPAATLDRCMVGRSARIEPGAQVAESVVVEGAVVGTGARVIGSILMGRVEAGPGEHLTGVVRAAAG
ncbi:MAG: NDP-sugar synthase [Acidobacteria bacterium]|nr:NDP-sugar synthase [Acidobacteriota bacterium]